MASLDLTAATAALKELYDGQKVINLVYKKNPLLAMMKKKTNQGGKYIPVPTQYGVSQGRSSTFSYAQANQTAPKLAEFLVTRVSDYAVATITNEMIEASASDAEAFISMAKLNVDSAFTSITNSLASAMYRSGTGVIGKIASGGITSGVITLDDPHSVTQFEVGQTLNACASDGGTQRTELGYCIAVNRAAGTITVASDSLAGTAASPSNWAAADYLMVQGDLNSKVSGLAAWVPASAPASTAFFGVNRATDSRLGGLRYSASSQSIEEGLIDAAALVAREGGSSRHCFTNFTSYGSLVKSLGAKVQYEDMQSEVGIGFRGIRVEGEDGPITVIPDRNCPGLTAYLLDLDTWCLHSVGDAPHIVTYGKEGLEMLRVSNADSAEVRVAYYANMSCNAPGWNCNVTLGA